MSDRVDPNATNNVSSTFLPRLYRTDSNTKFLQATVEQLVQQGTVSKLNGFIGRQFAKATSGNDIFVEASDSTRQNYQLEPSIVINDQENNNIFFKDYQDYINSINLNGGIVTNHNRLNKEECYSWDPKINWDKFVNFQNYYWLTPSVITISGAQQHIINSYNVTLSTTGNTTEYVFTPNGISKDPLLNLFRGQTYIFNINCPGNPFSIKTSNSIGSVDRYISDFVSDYAVEVGTITFTVPDSAPDTLYYQSETNNNAGGSFSVKYIYQNTFINVEQDIIGKDIYIMNNGYPLSNGMLVNFSGIVTPEKYNTGTYFVEGVGSNIKLIPFENINTTGNDSPEYIVINRSSEDRNPWTRINRWVHSDVINTSNLLSSQTVELNQLKRASRPIIEFAENLKLYNYGHNWLMDVNFIDDITDDVLYKIEGSIGYYVDEYKLSDGDIIVAKNDNDYTVKNNIYKVRFINSKIHLELLSYPIVDSVIYVKSGTKNGSKYFWFNGTNWLEAQQKVKNNQAPLFDVVDENNISLSNTSVYSGSTFNGTKIFSYKIGTGKNDPVLQFPLTYKNISNIGDIVFNFDYITDTFNYKSSLTIETKNISIGFLTYTDYTGQINYTNGWSKSDNFIKQAGIRVYKNSNLYNKFDIDIFDNISQLTDLEVRIYVNGTRIQEYTNGNPNWVVIDSTKYKRVILLDSIKTYSILKTESSTNLLTTDDTSSFNIGDLIVIGNNVGNLLSKTTYYISSIPSVTTFTLSLKKGGDNIILSDSEIKTPLYFSSDIKDEDILTIKAFSKQAINSNGFYEIPNNLQNNPLNGDINNFTLGEVITHVDSIVDNLSNKFSGVFPGISNLRDLGDVSKYGSKFVRHSGPYGISMYHLTSDKFNIFQAIEESRDDYNRFKRNFITVAETLGVDTTVKNHVDLILQYITKNIPNTAPYYFSDMVPFGSNIKNEYIIAGFTTKQFPLINYFDMTVLSNKAVGVYLNETQLVINHEYIIDTQGYVQILVDLVNGDTVTIYEYENTDGCFIPETPTKLGLWPSYDPKIFKDTTLITPQWVIQGHDGSQILAYGTYDNDGTPDYRDYLILELEKRIYNNIKIKYDVSIFDINDILPSYTRSSDYSLEEFNKILAPSFYKWTTLIDVDFSEVIGFDRNNPFTFNYNKNYTLDGRLVPGYWRGIYKWMFDTDRPHLCPWEMLGVTDKPSWWDSVYGPAPYTSDNLILWTDISNGLFNDPISPVTLDRFKKPFLMSHIPVDEYGNLLNPIDSGIVQGIVTDSISDNFVFGDVGPVENSWRRSSHYPFSIILTSLLMTPANTLGKILDISRIKRNLTGQLIYNETHITPYTIKIPSIYSSSTRVQTAGIINFITNHIVSDKLDLYTQYNYELQNIKYVLSYRLGGFSSKEQFNLILDSKSQQTTSNVFVPKDDYSLILNTSSPIKKITYSGVIITKVYDGYTVKGYSKTQPYFTYYNWIQSGSTITVGGISENFSSWTSGRTYIKGQIIKYNTEFYVAETYIKGDTTFDITKYRHLTALPIIGGRTATFRKTWNKSNPITIPYNTKFASVQEIVDFLTGYGEWLTDQGFIFDEFNTNLNHVTNWDTSAKEFMFWTTQNWSAGEDIWDNWRPDTLITFNSIVEYEGSYYRAIKNVQPASIFDYDYYEKLDGLSSIGSSVISLSPAANSIIFSTKLSVVDDISNKLNEYEILKVNGQPISPNNLSSSRNKNLVIYKPTNDDGIYNASFYLVQKEHVVVMNNTTMFNDLIYDPTTGYKQDRIKISAYVSSNWYGGFDVPGFVFDEATVTNWESWKQYYMGDVVKYQSFYYSAKSFITGTEIFDSAQWNRLSKKPEPKIIPNWTNIATQFTDFYSLDDDHFDNSQQMMAQHLVGYQKRQYLSNIIQDNVSEFKFYQGMIREKGTQNVFNKLFGVLAYGGKENLTFNEEWLLRVGQYGANSSFEEVEFVLNQSKFKSNPQTIELVDTKSSYSGLVIQQIPTDVYVKPISYKSELLPTISNTTTKYLRSGGYVRPNEVNLTLKTINDIVNTNIADFSEGDYVWCTFENTSWNVYRYTNSDLSVVSITYANNELSITVSGTTRLPAGSYIGITGAPKITGFYKVKSQQSLVIIAEAPNLSFQSPTHYTEIKIYKLSSQRAGSINDATSVLNYPLKSNELLWTDDNGSGKWATWEYNSVYTGRLLPNPYTSIQKNYGRAIASDETGKYVGISTAAGVVYVYKTVGKIRQLHQVLEKPFMSNNDINPDNLFGKVIAISKDGKWMAVGSPDISNACTDLAISAKWDNNQVPFSSTTVSFDNDSSSQTTNAVEGLIFTTPSGNNSVYINQGVVTLYKQDAYNNYYLVGTFVSPEPNSSEFFGVSLEFGTDELYIGAKGSNNKGKVYKITYNMKVVATSMYEPYGSGGNVVNIVSSPNKNLLGLYVMGNGLTNKQQVIEYKSETPTTVTLSSPPNGIVSGLLNFVSYNWDYSTSISGLSTDNLFGLNVKISKDESTLLISSEGKVKIYKKPNNQLEFDYNTPQVISGQTTNFGKSISISNDGTYIAISDSLYTGTYSHQGIVKIYSKENTNYDVYEEIENLYPRINAEFGTNISFMDDNHTLVIHSRYKDSPSSFVDIYDRYTTKWIYSETLPLLSFTADKIIIGNRYTITSLGNTDFTTLGSFENVVDRVFVATQYADLDHNKGTVVLNIENDDVVLGFCVTGFGILIGAPMGDDGYVDSGLVFEYNKPGDVYSWSIKHQETDKPEISKIKKIFLYNNKTNDVVSYIDVIDPLQGKIAGPAEQELSFKTPYDPAIYSVGDSTVNVDEGIAWTTKQVGKLWWDIRTSKFIESYDNELSYRSSTWNTLVFGASVDIYEWVETKLLPANWDALADTDIGLASGISGKSLYGNTNYSVKTYYDNVSKTLKNTYYFWVKNKAIVPDIIGRNTSAQNVSNLIASPLKYAYKYVSFTSSNSFEVANVGQVLSDDDIVLSIQYWTIDNIQQNIHSQWKLISNDTGSSIPSAIEQKWFDSLCGSDVNGRAVPDVDLPFKLKYGVENRPRQGMFVNRIEAIKQLVEQTNKVLVNNQIAWTRNLYSLEQYDNPPLELSGLYDVIKHTDAELKFINVSSIELPQLSPEIVDGKIVNVNIIKKGSGYVIAPTIQILGSGINAVIKSKINSVGQIIETTIVDGGDGYNSETKLVVRNYSVLVESDSLSNGGWAIYSYDLDKMEWNRTLIKSYDNRDYWYYIDWYNTNYNQFTAVTHSVDIFPDLIELNPSVGDIIKVRYGNNGKWILVRRDNDKESLDWTESYSIIGIEKGTIQISDTIYDSTIAQYDRTLYNSYGYDQNSDVELRNILLSLRDDILIDDLRNEYLNLFFNSVRYIYSEQSFVDWIIKSSFVKATHNVGNLSQPVTFKNDNLSDFESYVNEVKPYRTKVREYVSSYKNIDTNTVSVSDFDLPPVYSQGGTTVIESVLINNKIEVYNTEITQYPWKSWYDNIGFSIKSITIINHGYGYDTEPTIEVISPTGKGAILKPILTNGVVSEIQVVSGGFGYISAPQIILSTPGFGQPAVAVAVIGNSLVRTNTIKLKFDRISPRYFINKLEETETFIATQGQSEFELLWAPDIKIGYSSITINGVLITSEQYDIRISSVLKNDNRGIEFTRYYGVVTLNLSINTGDEVTITYKKDASILSAADRIHFYYNPKSTDLGNDLSQLMTGVDYGGVIVNGVSFDINKGWDSLPYLSDRWDSYDPTFKDVKIIANSNQQSFNLNYIPNNGVIINVYCNDIRIDDINFNTPSQTNPSAIMVSPVIGVVSDTITVNQDGTISINIPTIYKVISGDKFIFRESTSDGSIQTFEDDYDTKYDGGNMAYTTASGYNPSDIVVDGDGFVTPTTSYAPEEVVPGQVVDAVSIKVFENNEIISGNIKVMKFITDGIKDSFDIGQRLNNNQSVIVTLTTYTNESGEISSLTRIKKLDEDYTINYIENLVVFNVIPPIGCEVTLFSIGVNSTNIVDIDYIISNGNTDFYPTKTVWNSTYIVDAFVNGYSEGFTVQNHNGILGIKFTNIPPVGSMINYIVVNSSVRSFTVTTTENIVIPVNGLNANTPININSVVGLATNNENNIIVIIDQTILPPTGYNYYPPTQVSTAKISFTVGLVHDNNVTIISSYNNQILNVERNEILVPEVIHSVDTPEYYADLVILGGTITLNKSVKDENYLWIFKNGTILIPSVDYVLNEDKISIKLAKNPKKSDSFDVMTFNSNTTTNIAYMQFKDMINRTYYKDIDIKKQSYLSKPLNWNDEFIVVENSSVFDVPEKDKNIPGVIEIGSERIEYFEIEGNKLSQLRRATMGTGAAPKYSAGTIVQNIGVSSNILYSDKTITQTIEVTQQMLNNNNLINVNFTPIKSNTVWDFDEGFTSSIPSTYGQCDEIEVFVGGYNIKTWTQNVNYNAGDIAIYGSYTYKCIMSHTSTSIFDELKWEFFVTNIRLKKEPYKVFNINKSSYSPLGDVQFDADYSVDGTTKQIRLTNPVPVGTRIIVVRRFGSKWNNKYTIL